MGKYLDVHVIETVGPSCVNRDDSGSPKTCIFGGVTRARVSSQCWKRAVRKYFQKHKMTEGNNGIRTKKFVNLLYDRVIQKDSTLAAEKTKEDLAKLVDGLINKQKNDDNDKKKKNGKASNAKESGPDDVVKALVFISEKQLDGLADYYLKFCQDPETYPLVPKDSKKKNEADAKKLLKDIFMKNPSIDMALFGRMFASHADESYDAACQVAHAISTHKVDTEYDYYTAVDDKSEDDEQGSAFLDTNEFFSATLYRYATIDLDHLAEMLGGKEQAASAAADFVKAFACSMPTGKLNSYANDAIPDEVHAVLRDDAPVSLVAAFEKPVWTAHDGYIDASKEAMYAYEKKVCQFYDPAIESWTIGYGGEGLARKENKFESINELCDSVRDTLLV